jgi:hypothetical protein
MVYTRPPPLPLRSARSWNSRSSWPKAAPVMSSTVSPSPRPLSGSLLAIETRRTAGAASQTSLTAIEARIVAIL